MEHRIKISSIEKITADVLQITTDKPKDFTFVPGQATEISMTKEAWKEVKRPFTFSSIPTDDHLEFVIKTYPSHQGVTNQFRYLKKDEMLILTDAFGDINYKGEGIFIAGGAGITPFISIFRDLQSKKCIGNNKLIYANKTKADIILKKEFEDILGDNFINILSDEKTEEYPSGYITKDIIKTNMLTRKSYFYLCGPPAMMDAVETQLTDLGINKELVIKEGF